MTSAHEALSQLLSPVQATVLIDAANDAWLHGASAIESILDASPAIDDVASRLVMPDEVTAEFEEPHIVVALSASTEAAPPARGFLVVPTAFAAMVFNTTAEDPGDEQNQTAMFVSTVADQLLSAVNDAMFPASANGLALSIAETAAGAMPGVLEQLDEPCLYVTATVEIGRPLPIAFLFPGEFLDVVSAGYEPADLPSLDDPDVVAPTVVRADALAETPNWNATPETAVEKEPTPISSVPRAQKAQFGPLSGPAVPPQPSNIELLADLQMRVSVELGRTRLSVADVLALGAGSVVELDRLAGEPVDILVNDRIIARGEVVVVDENFGVRIVEVLARSRDLGKAI